VYIYMLLITIQPIKPFFMLIRFFRIIHKTSFLHFPIYLSIILCGLHTGCQPDQKADNNLALSGEQQHLPENALRGLKWADDLQVSLFAHEPMLINPTNIDIDEKGRVWVCEGYN